MGGACREEGNSAFITVLNAAEICNSLFKISAETERPSLGWTPKSLFPLTSHPQPSGYTGWVPGENWVSMPTVGVMYLEQSFFFLAFSIFEYVFSCF